jgi:hypothetical protein
MNAYQKAFLKSLGLIEAESANNASVVATIPYFDNGVKRLSAIKVEIEGLSVIQDIDLTGITDDKNSFQDEARDFLVEVSGAIHSYANLQGNKTLQSLVDYNDRKAARLDQQGLINACTTTLDEAHKIPAKDMADAGVSAEELADFDNILTQLKASTGSRREAGIDQSAATKRIGKLFDEAADLKKNTLDRLAPQFQRKAPEFYFKYKAAANVIHRRASKKVNEEAKA